MNCQTLCQTVNIVNGSPNSQWTLAVDNLGLGADGPTVT